MKQQLCPHWSTVSHYNYSYKLASDLKTEQHGLNIRHSGYVPQCSPQQPWTGPLFHLDWLDTEWMLSLAHEHWSFATGGFHLHMSIGALQQETFPWTGFCLAQTDSQAVFVSATKNGMLSNWLVFQPSSVNLNFWSSDTPYLFRVYISQPCVC